MDINKNGWPEYKKLVLEVMDGLRTENKELKVRLAEIEKTLYVIKVMLGLVAGGIPTALTIWQVFSK